MAMVEDAYVRNYRPLFVIGQSGVMRYAETPMLAELPDRDVSSPLAQNAAMQPGLISPPNQIPD
jgi:hypothetical protein